MAQSSAAHMNVHMQMGEAKPFDGASPASLHHGAASEDVAVAATHGSLGGSAQHAGAGAGAGEGEGEVNESLKTIFKWINKVLTDLPNMR